LQPYKDENIVENTRRIATFSTRTRLLLIALTCVLIVSISVSNMMYKIIDSFILLIIFYSLIKDYFIRELL